MYILTYDVRILNDKNHTERCDKVWDEKEMGIKEMKCQSRKCHWNVPLEEIQMKAIGDNLLNSCSLLVLSLLLEGILEPFMLMLYTVSGTLHYTISGWMSTGDPLAAPEFAHWLLSFLCFWLKSWLYGVEDLSAVFLEFARLLQTHLVVFLVFAYF